MIHLFDPDHYLDHRPSDGSWEVHEKAGKAVYDPFFRVMRIDGELSEIVNLLTVSPRISKTTFKVTA